MLNERNIGPIEDLRESLFLERYQRLLSWAIRLTNDRASAEDLVQDAFIQFTRGRTSLDTIANVDGYLRRMLRYLHLARVTRHTELHRPSLSIADYDCLSLGLRAFDIYRYLEVKEQLIEICRYACIRKETSRTGSVLILRFFHEYTPSEISKLLCRPRHSVDEWQRVARKEMKTYLENPRQLTFIRSNAGPKVKGPDGFTARADLSTALRQTIFNSRQGDCLTVDQFKDIYVSEILEKLKPETLAHIVSCRNCLDAANRLLGLPTLSERFDLDEHDHFDPPNNGNGSGGSLSEIRRRFTRHVREVVDHKPQQLRIRMNGVLVSSFRVGSDGGEFQLKLNRLPEPSFIDVSSEQGVTLLLFEANAKNESWGQIDLSEGRLLDASLCGDTLTVVYHATERDKTTECEPLILLPSAADEISICNDYRFWQRLKTAIKTQFLRQAWLNPAGVTLLVATVLLLATSFKPHRLPAITPRSLLERALIAEQHNSVRRVTHRIITFEERQPTQGTVASRQRIEVWEDTSTGARADRIFDEHNLLVAERLQLKNSSAAVFHHSKAQSQSLAAEDIFHLQPTVCTFESLVATNTVLAMEQRPGLYVISYSGNSNTSIGQLLKATLTLSEQDLHPIEQELVIERDGQIKEYRFIEVRFDQVDRKELDSAVFQPTPETKSSPSVSRVSTGLNSISSEGRRNSVASAELEIEVAYLLDKAKAERNEQIQLLRNKNGSLRIDGVVETSTRKNELLQMFTPLVNNRLVSINIQAADSVSTQDLKNNIAWSTAPTTNSIVERIAVDRELREYLLKTRSGQSHGNDLDRDVNAFASQIVNRSYRALFHAVELKQLAVRFSVTDMRNIRAESRSKLHEMVRTHAEAFSREYSILMKELAPIFRRQGSSAVGEENHINNDEQLIAAVQKLYRLARINNDKMRSAFTVSTQNSSLEINSERFWNDLIESQQTAKRIASY